MKSSKETPMPVVSALAVGAAEVDQFHLEKIFGNCGWILRSVRTPAEARNFLNSTTVSVIIAEGSQPGGGWREILNSLHDRPEAPSVIVTSRLADDGLWAEVLNMGGYDVLATPLDGEEVTRVVTAAARHFDHERRRSKPAGKTAMRFAAAG